MKVGYPVSDGDVGIPLLVNSGGVYVVSQLGSSVAISDPLPTGDNNIGNVDIVSMPVNAATTDGITSFQLANYVAVRTSGDVKTVVAVNQVYATRSTAGTTEVVAAPGANQCVFVLGYSLSCAGANTITLESGTTDKMVWLADANGWGVESSRPGTIICAANQAFNLTTSAAVATHLACTYCIAPTT